MIEKNIYVTNPLIFIDKVLKLLCLNNISYVCIKNKGYIELHFDSYVFNIYCLVNSNIANNINNDLLQFIDNDNYIQNSNEKIKKEQTGFKKYNKTRIKEDRNNYRIKNRCIGVKTFKR